MIRVLVVDDSTTVRRRLSALFGGAPDFEVIAQAASGIEALRWVRAVEPDLVSLDVFLPNESAAQVVRGLKAATPVPIVLVSEAPRQAPEVFEAIAAGALDLLTKPKLGDAAAEIAFLKLMRSLSRVRPQHMRLPAHRPRKRVELVVIGASTGGPAALREVLAGLPADFPAAVLVAQHLAPGFEDALVDWLSHDVRLPMTVARYEQPIVPGEIIVAKPGTDLEVVARDRVATRSVGAGAYHPSADRLFSSAATMFPGVVLGVVLTGIGSDGARGAKELAESGSSVIAQDRESSAVYGMPGAVARAGTALALLPPASISRWIVEAVFGRAGRPAKP